jgi:N-acetylmuramoyl-L-alanine amidase
MAQAGSERWDPDEASTPTATLAQVSNWQFDPAQGRLEVTTQGDVRPSLFILQNPPRVVLDFPNTRTGRDPLDQSYTGRVKSLQLSQLTDTVARFVLTLEESDTLTLEQLQLQTADPNRWAVQFTGAADLMAPTPVASLPEPASAPLQPLLPSTPVAALTPTPPLPAPVLVPPAPVSAPLGNAPLGNAPPLVSQSSLAQLLSVSGTEEGFFVKTTGPVSASVRRITDPERVVVDLLGTSVSKSLTQREFTSNRLGVSQVRIGQFEPTVARVVLDVDPSSGDWESTYDAQAGGVFIFPAGGQMDASLLPDTPSNYQGPLATIQAVTLQGNQLTIAADGFLFYRSGWDPGSGGYRISVTPARLPESLPDPGLPANGPVERIRFVQDTPQTVSILVQPSQEFNVVEESPGQGTRRINLLVQPVGNAPVGNPPAVSPPPDGPGYTAPKNSIVIALDAGHGGRDPGALGANGIQEKNITLSVAIRAAHLLQQKGYGVILTRSDDREILLQPRVNTAVAYQADILVSIHANALERSSISGTETYYLRPDSARLATTLHRYIVAGVGSLDRGVRRARFFMVRETPTTMPSVLLEMGYVTNPTEGSRLNTPEYQDRLAQSIVQGIEAYFGTATP